MPYTGFLCAPVAAVAAGGTLVIGNSVGGFYVPSRASIDAA